MARNDCDEMNRDGDPVSSTQYGVSYDDAERSVERAIQMLLKNDIYLLEHDLHERTITHCLAIHLAEQFPEWTVDCEYNRDLNEGDGVEKVVKKIGTARDGKYDDHAVYPDIIVHHRGKARNLLVIEVKKDGGNDAYDKRKLLEYKNTLGYEYAFFLRFYTGLKPKHPSRYCLDPM